MDFVQKQKRNLRKEYLSIRNGMSEDEILAMSHDIMESVVSSYDFLQAKHVLVYASYGSEVNTTGMIAYAFLLKKRVYCPKVIEEGVMEFYEIHSLDDLKPGYKGIPEPTDGNQTPFVQTEGEKAIVLMPGVCFDEKGHRIGYGKGFYDQYLSKKDNMIKMALAYDNQIAENIPSGEMDISYDFLVTELQTICLLEDEE
ncbi:MAG: 5-formyltetrahydrofolate cyclo-ligase [Lachnospiraceae bacterium]|nr:5-formyltetrahydrofolate cyclo-ligase [Lachnospiraceae bacterium]